MKGSKTTFGFSFSIVSQLFLLQTALSAFASLSAVAGENQPTALPIRISTSFLNQNNLTGSYSVQSNIPVLNWNISSPIEWSEIPTDEPAPSPGAIADFRDSVGCASYTDAPVALCFKVMGDVMSVGVNSREMKTRGVRESLNQILAYADDSECTYRVRDTHFIEATGTNTDVTLLFAADAVTEQGCPHPDIQPIQIQFSLRSI